MKQFKKIKFFLLITFLIFSISCSQEKPTPHGTAPGSSNNAPAWVNSLPEEEGFLYFVGISKAYSNKQSSRDDARRNARDQVIEYMGTQAKSKFEAATVSYGLEENVIDPTTSSREFQQQLSQGLVSYLKAKEYYEEYIVDSNGKNGIVSNVLMRIANDDINNAFKKTVQDNLADAQQKAKDSADARAKDQAQKAADFWRSLQEDSIFN